jgi:hypothetical protein
MLVRNLVFLGLILAGVVFLGYQLFPEEVPEHAPQFSAVPYQVDDFRQTVEKVNAAFRQEWSENEIQPAGPANDLQLARRVSLALTGSIPSLQEVRQLERYEGDAKLTWWTEGLLQDRRYADYFAERFARVYVGTENGPFVLFRRRRFVLWLSDQITNNRPYDDLARELIAGQGLWTDKPSTNFISVTIEPDKKKGPDPDRLGARVARAFLGIRLDCAQCHDHPFQDWKQKDFEGLAAFFGRTKHGFTGIYDDSKGAYEVENRKTLKKETVAPKVPYSPQLVPQDGSWREQLAAWVTSPENPFFAQTTVNRVWALLLGRPLVEPVDDLYAAKTRPAALEILAEDFKTHGHDLRRLIQLIVATHVFQLDSAADHEVTDAHDRVWAAFPLTRLRPEQVVGSIGQAASVETIGADSHVVTQIVKAINQNDFVKRYGDTGQDEFDARSGTIPQRLLLMNGEIVNDKTKPEFFNASARVAMMAPSDAKVVEIAFLMTLTRRPSREESEYFQKRLAGWLPPETMPVSNEPEDRSGVRAQRVQDLFWSLINTTEFSWNH